MAIRVGDYKLIVGQFARCGRNPNRAGVGLGFVGWGVLRIRFAWDVRYPQSRDIHPVVRNPHMTPHCHIWYAHIANLSAG